MYATVDLRNYARNLADPVAAAEANFREVHPGIGLGFPSGHDYARFSLAYEMASATSGSVLDVGVGSGQLLNALAMGGQFTRVCGIDVKQHSKFTRFSDGFHLLLMNVTHLEFEDNEFDVVICMEVLEHLQHRDFLKALSELRRVCASRLIMSVPYAEPEPLPRHHKLRFGDDELRQYFPNAKFVLLQGPPVPWMLINEAGTLNADVKGDTRSESGIP